ncbi:MAG TPA: 3-hydroxyacyl-ACP dehydratase FabZ family protein [Pirellulales bacterium]|nr:3-hydroxyacyl-ACP dehydratase FabZ family protein [Pirellulales bacterium]
MRWIWIDRFLEFDSGRRATAIKNVSLAEEHLHDHFPGYPVMPNSLILEGLAQTGGLLVGEVNQFEEKVILAKVSKAVFHFLAVPGDTLRYTATIETIGGGGAGVKATSHVGERLQGEADIMFAHLDDAGRAKTLFEPKNFVFTMKLLGVFDVGRTSDGKKLTEPPGLAKLIEALGDGR